jgi:hypothetical protein
MISFDESEISKEEFEKLIADNDVFKIHSGDACLCIPKASVTFQGMVDLHLLDKLIKQAKMSSDIVELSNLG